MANKRTHDPLIRQTDRLTQLARGFLFWERYAPVFALAMVFVGLFLIGAFAGVWERIGDPWRGLMLLAALGMLARSARQARSVNRPSRSEARRRVETDNHVAHRPLDTINDTPAVSADVWPAHVKAARAQASGLKRPTLRPALAAKDPYYLRFALPVAIGLALMVGAGDNGERLRAALSPTWQSGVNPQDVTFEAWADPPAYTRRPPIYFNNQSAIDIPQGSEVVARLNGAKTGVRLKWISGTRARYWPVDKVSDDVFETRGIVKTSGTARWRIGTKEQAWTLNALPDTPPTLTIDIHPRADKRDRLVTTYSLSDDYGVTDLSLTLRLLSEDPTEAALRDSVKMPLSQSSVLTAEFQETALDLTRHKWAGRKVAGVFTATDGAGQTATSEDVFFTIPDKIFIEPIAKAVIEQRALVLAGQNTPYTDAPRMTRKKARTMPWFDTYDTENRLGRAAPPLQRAAELIDAITDVPDGLYDDAAVYLGLRNAASRLRYAKSVEALDGLPDDLWSIAMRAEFGVLGTALEEMRAAQRNLRDGIARRAPQRETDTLFLRYNEAVDRYTDELTEQAAKDGNVAQAGGGGGGAAGSLDQIQELLDAIEEANRVGDTEGARKALAKLAELLENMKIQLAQGGGGQGGDREGSMSEEMRETLEELSDMLGEQRDIRDETEQQAENSGSGQSEQKDGKDEQANTGSGGAEGESEDGSGGRSLRELAEDQQALEQGLEKLSEALPDGGGNEEDDNAEARRAAEKALEDAQQAMTESRDALEQGNAGAAQDAQGRAIDALRRAGRSLADSLPQDEERDGQSAESGQGDPLGREGNGGRDNGESDVDIEQKDNATRSRELLEELRRRAGEHERRQIERDYLERLLKRF